jgi:CheY-like chemotaxis protein
MLTYKYTIRSPMPKILSAGSDATLLYTRNSLLAQMGATVIAAPTAAAAAELILAEKFDLIVLCHSFREKERQELARLLRWHAPHTPVIVMANNGQEADGSATIVDNSPEALTRTVRRLMMIRRTG